MAEHNGIRHQLQRCARRYISWRGLSGQRPSRFEQQRSWNPIHQRCLHENRRRATTRRAARLPQQSALPRHLLPAIVPKAGEDWLGHRRNEPHVNDRRRLPDYDNHSTAYYGNGDWCSCNIPLNNLLNVDPARRLNLNFWAEQQGFRSRHPGGAQFCLVDGRCDLSPESMDNQTYRVACSRNGSEPLTLDLVSLAGAFAMRPIGLAQESSSLLRLLPVSFCCWSSSGCQRASYDRLRHCNTRRQTAYRSASDARGQLFFSPMAGMGRWPQDFLIRPGISIWRPDRLRKLRRESIMSPFPLRSFCQSRTRRRARPRS